jgi:hypothetical protein
MDDLRFTEQLSHCESVVGTRSKFKVDRHRPDPKNKLGYLSDDQHLQLVRWLLKSGFSYAKILCLIKEKFGISCGVTCLSRYFLKNVAQYMITRRQRNVDIALQVKGASKLNNDEFVPLTLDNIKRMVWEMSNDPHADPRHIKIYYELLLRAEDNAIKRETLSVKMRRLDILEKRLKAAEEAASDLKLGDKEFADRIRGIFKRDEISHTNGQSKTQDTRVHTNGITT